MEQVLRSDSVEIREKAKEVNQLRGEIEAHGTVVVHKDGRVALSNNANYFSREEKIVLTGEARIVENENQLGGEKITLFMNNDRSIVESGKVLMYQDKQDKTSSGKKRK